MWSIGCILAEMLLGKPLFPGSSTLNQIERIMSVIPRPDKNDIDSIKSEYGHSILEKASLRYAYFVVMRYYGKYSLLLRLAFFLLVAEGHEPVNQVQATTSG